MYLTINTRDVRKYPSWLVRVQIGERWWQVANLLHPRFWSHWWTMWEGKRAWALRFWLRHMIVSIDRPWTEQEAA